MTNLLATAAYSLVSLPALASSVVNTLDHTPYQTDRFSIGVSRTATGGGGWSYRVVVHPVRGALPKTFQATISKFVKQPNGFEIFHQRKLVLQPRGGDLVVSFEVAKALVPKWSFELDEYAESNGRPMPSFTGYRFAFAKPPVVRG